MQTSRKELGLFSPTRIYHGVPKWWLNAVGSRVELQNALGGADCLIVLQFGPSLRRAAYSIPVISR